jgi:hypothetical protein
VETRPLIEGEVAMMDPVTLLLLGVGMHIAARIADVLAQSMR